jgi:HD superfamily phosphohydrolase YqeK
VAHIRRVADLLGAWADAMATPPAERSRWLRAAYLHDALKDAPPDLLRALAPDAWDRDALRHGPAAATLAAQHGETDRGVLDAVRYHSVGYAGWDSVGQMLYLADYLEPGRGTHPDVRAQRAARVPGAPRRVLREVAQERVGHKIAQGYVLVPETVAFWNALVCDG